MRKPLLLVSTRSASVQRHDSVVEQSIVLLLMVASVFFFEGEIIYSAEQINVKLYSLDVHLQSEMKYDELYGGRE